MPHSDRSQDSQRAYPARNERFSSPIVRALPARAPAATGKVPQIPKAQDPARRAQRRWPQATRARCVVVIVGHRRHGRGHDSRYTVTLAWRPAPPCDDHAAQTTPSSPSGGMTTIAQRGRLDRHLAGLALAGIAKDRPWRFFSPARLTPHSPADRGRGSSHTSRKTHHVLANRSHGRQPARPGGVALSAASCRSRQGEAVGVLRWRRHPRARSRPPHRPARVTGPAGHPPRLPTVFGTRWPSAPWPPQRPTPGE